MSTDLTQQENCSTSSTEREADDFNYRPVPILACVSFTLGILSGTALLVDFGVALAFTGMVLGFFAFRQQKKHSGVIGGKRLVWVGCLTSVVFFFGGLRTHIHAYQTELPEGHLRVNFPRDISMKKIVWNKAGRCFIPNEIAENYLGKKIFIKGYMYQTRSLKDLSSFVFLKDNGECCMGGSPKPWDNMTVIMQNGKKVDAILNKLVAVSGTLKINPNAGPTDVVYFLEATHVEKAKTRY